MFDSHIHTTFSTDSKMDIEAAVKRAEELKLGIIITEHMDLNYPVEGCFVFDCNKYFKEYSKFRSDKVLIGIELGMIADRVQENKKLIESHPFDYVIGSTHLVDNIDVYSKDFYADKSKQEAYEHYFNYMLQCIKTHSFVDSLGHIDFIARYSIYDDKEIYYEEFFEYIDEILKAAIKNNKIIELNTRRLSNAEAVKNLLKIYKRYYELGGRNVTIGSDAHTAASIGSSLDTANELAESCGLKTVYFKERKPEYI